MEMETRSQSPCKKVIKHKWIKKAGIHKENSVSPAWKRNRSRMRQNPLLTMIHLWPVEAPPGCRVPGGWSISGLHPGQVAIYRYQLASLHLNTTSNIGVVFIYQFILSCPDSTVAARGMYVHGRVGSVLTLGKLHRVSWQAIRLRLFFHLIVLLLPARAATCRRKVLLISKAGYLPPIQLSSGFQPIWPEGTSVPLIELTPASHQGLIKRWRW